jgi:hypothetical protein
MEYYGAFDGSPEGRDPGLLDDHAQSREGSLGYNLDLQDFSDFGIFTLYIKHPGIVDDQDTPSRLP